MKVVFSYHGGNWASAKREFEFQVKRATLRGANGGQKLNPDDRVFLSVSAREFKRLFPNVPIKHTSKAARERYGQ